MTDPLHQQVADFAGQINSTLGAVLGGSDDHLHSTLLEGERLVVASLDPKGIRLPLSEAAALRLQVKFYCVWDTPQSYMAVRGSEFKVFLEGDQEPLFRYEFDMDAHRSVPCAHVQVHAHRDSFTTAMNRTGERSRRAKQRRAAPRPKMQDVHFPLGGPRMRPALEDLLQMLVEEFGVDAADDWQARLEDARESYRRVQTRAVVRDSQDDAVKALRDLGYEIKPPPQAEGAGGRRLRQY